jgi:hypothetical protein
LEIRDEAHNFHDLFSGLAVNDDPSHERFRVRGIRDECPLTGYPATGDSYRPLQATSTGQQRPGGHRSRQTSSSSGRSSTTSNNTGIEGSSKASSSSNTAPTRSVNTSSGSTNTGLTSKKTSSPASTEVDAIHCPVWKSAKKYRDDLPEACKKEFESADAAR